MEKKRTVILIADIQGSTEFGHTQSVENYNEMLRDYHRTAQAAVEDYCQRYELERARLTCSGKGDECCIFITDGRPGEDEEHALRLAVYLKERWKQSDFVVRIQKAAQTGLIPQVDLRIGVGSGDIACDHDCWTDQDTYEGIVISQAKRIEGMADQAAETLMMVKWQVKDACQEAGLGVEFGGGRRLAGKGIPEGVDIAVYPVAKYGDWAKVQRAVPKAEKPEWARLFDEALALGNSGDHDRALEFFQKAVKLRPEPAVWAYLGQACARKQQYDRAIGAFRQALELRPDYPEAWTSLGVAYGQKEEYNRAMEAHRKALELRPDYAPAFYNLACAYSLKRELRPALRHLRRAIELAPQWREMARTDPDFDPIRDRPAFRRLVDRSD